MMPLSIRLRPLTFATARRISSCCSLVATEPVRSTTPPTTLISTLAPLGTAPLDFRVEATFSAISWFSALAAADMGPALFIWATAGPAAHRPKAAASGISLRAVTGDLLVSDSDGPSLCSVMCSTGKGRLEKGGRQHAPHRLSGGVRQSAQPSQSRKAQWHELARVDLLL